MRTRDYPSLLRQNKRRRDREALTSFKAATTVSAWDLRAPSAWGYDWAFGGATTQSGQMVSEESAKGVSVWWACVVGISADFGQMSASVFRDLGDDRREKAPTHPSHRIVHDEFNPLLAAGIGWEMATAQCLVRGNFYAPITRDGSARAAEMWPVDNGRVKPVTEGRRLVYQVTGVNGEPDREVLPGDMFHLRGPGDMLEGWSVIRQARESLGLTVAAERFGENFFAHDATMGITLKTPADMKPEMREAYQKKLDENADKKFRILMLPGGVEAQRMMVPPEDIQFLETRQFQVEEVCRWFRMPPHKVQHLLRATFNTIEELSIDYVQSAIMPWARRAEQECRRKLFSQSSRTVFYVKFNADALLRGRSEQRAEVLTKYVTSGQMTINEARALNDLNPIRGGDTPLIQGAMTRLDDILNPPEPPMPTMPQGPPDDDDDAPPAETTNESARFYPIFMDAASRCVRREINAVKQKRGSSPLSFKVWTERFAKQQREYVETAFAPLFECFGTPPKAVLAAWLDDFERSAKGRLAEDASQYEKFEPEAAAALAESALELVAKE